MAETPKDIYPPSPATVEKATIKDYETVYKHSIENREAFWAEEAGQL